jgi:signal transduction histidine kinase
VTRPDLVDRLAALPNLGAIPRDELAWLVAHGELEAHEAGTVIGAKGHRVRSLWIILSGHVVVRVDRGAGPRRVIEWGAGHVSGMLPYSRMTGPPGDNYVEEATELLAIHERHFPGMIRECPAFTAHTVHLMLDRARSFSASDLQDEKMISLGRLAAGLAHELNNPASATVRSAKLLLTDLREADAASRALGAAGLTSEQLAAIERTRAGCAQAPAGHLLSPIQRADREDAIADWLSRHACEPAYAEALVESAVTLDALDALARVLSGDTLAAGLRWIASGCRTHALALDIERAATRIHELVAAVKRFTHMDHLAGPDVVDVEPGIRDTVRVLAAKAKQKGAAVTLDIAPDLPQVHASGGELNQILFNLIDNALDAVPESGHIEISARRELEHVVVRVVDDGSGIPPDVLPRVFDAFFTTKPPGQGTGLGLEITRRLVRRYQGDLEVESRPGRTEFRVSLLAETADSGLRDEPAGEDAG